MSAPASASSDFPLLRRAVKTAFGNAGLALLSSFIALGALFGDAGFALWQAALFTVAGYALPGQLVTAELIAGGAGVLAVAAAVWFVNARLLPMTVVLLPLLADPAAPRRYPYWTNLALSHFVAVTSWVCFLDSYASVPAARRRAYFAVLGGLLWAGGIAATVLGYLIGARLPHDWLVVLLFLNPAYFLCVMLRSLKRRGETAAFAGGIIALPAAHMWLPQWDIVVAGIVSGALAFVLFERRR